jgi:hypothetical protein
MRRDHLAAVAFFTAGTLSLWHTPAFAYLGPGAGLAAIGALLALILGMILAFFGFLWYPVKRLLRQRRNASAENPVEKPRAGSVDENA